MIWRKKFEIGVKQIDAQHKELFERVFSFLEVARGDYGRAEKYQRLEETLSFMGKYVHVHFNSEEELQRSINYPDYENHHNIHKKFTDEVDVFATKFKKNGINDEDLQKFSGRLLTWLINHVVREDQKIAKYIDKNYNEEEYAFEKDKIKVIENSIENILKSMLQLDSEVIDKEGILLEERVIVSIGIFGKIKGNLYFSFPEEFALNAVKQMLVMELKEIDDFVKSAMGELINIITANISSEFNAGKTICNITPPDVYVGRDAENILNENYKTIFMKSKFGEFKVSTNIK